jgi:hypothetical protein
MLASHSDYFAQRAKGEQSWVSPASYSATVQNVGTVASDYVLLAFVSSPGRIAADPGSHARTHAAERHTI